MRSSAGLGNPQLSFDVKTGSSPEAGSTRIRPMTEMAFIGSLYKCTVDGVHDTRSPASDKDLAPDGGSEKNGQG
ncbi:hypothetical protein D3C84_857360 [compost metagenome]